MMTPQNYNSNQPVRLYGHYYSTKNRLYLDGEIIGKKTEKKVIFRPFRKTLGDMIVPIGMFEYIVTVNDDGVLNSYSN